MGCCTPFVDGGGKHIEAAWVREAELLRLDFFRSLVGGGGSDIHVERKEGGGELEVHP